jgi:hypothetical protein
MFGGIVMGFNLWFYRSEWFNVMNQEYYYADGWAEAAGAESGCLWVQE